MKPAGFAPPVGPLTPHHWLGIVVVLLMFLALGLGFWPGWTTIAAWWG